MKILIIQLARFGDVILTWPTLRALRREHPAAEIHLLVREKFQEVASGAVTQGDDKFTVHVLRSQKILESLVYEGEPAGRAEVTNLLQTLRSEKFDWIINLTFSPLSSEVTYFLASQSPNGRTTGYTRTNDGFLALPDETSRYYFSQVGLERMNRLHVAALFGSVAEVEIQAADWHLPNTSAHLDSDASSILVHVGASAAHKTLTEDEWTTALDQIAWQTDRPFVLLGVQSEAGAAQAILRPLLARHPGRFKNRVGHTSWVDLYSMFACAHGFIGGDSSLLHLASHAKIPTLYLRTGDVNFWETGPQSPEHLILPWPIEDERIAESMKLISSLFGRTLEPKRLICERSSRIDEQGWQLIEFLYFGMVEEIKPSSLEKEAFFHLHEMNEVVLETLPQMGEEKNNQIQNEILKRADEVFLKIGELCPEVTPLIRWYQTEKIQIGPSSFAHVLIETERAHRKFASRLETLINLADNDAGKN